MNTLSTAAVVVALLGSALIGGVFFAFSSFVMKALGRVPSAEGIAAMQSINVVVLNPSFLGAFIGTAVISLVVAILAAQEFGSESAGFLLTGSLLYLIGTFLVTAFGNVPLNDQLAAVSATSPDSVDLWQRYLKRWTMLNTVRTAAAMIAALSFTVGLIHSAG